MECVCAWCFPCNNMHYPVVASLGLGHGVGTVWARHVGSSPLRAGIYGWPRSLLLWPPGWEEIALPLAVSKIFSCTEIVCTFLRETRLLLIGLS